MRSFGWIRLSILVSTCLMSFVTYAYGPETLVLMRAQEIQSLPREDREVYLKAVKSIIAKGPDVFLLDESAHCSQGMKACAAALYGDNLCISKKLNNEAEACEAAAKRQEGYADHQWLIEPGGEQTWAAYEQRLNNFCSGGPTRELCRELQDKRVEIFMNRRTH